MKRRPPVITVRCTPIPHGQAVAIAVEIMEAMDGRREDERKEAAK